MERLAGFKPATFSLATRCSIPELQPQNGGSGGIRTHGTREGTSDFKSGALNRTQPRFLGANNRDRTCDLTLIRGVLSQLSYIRT